MFLEVIDVFIALTVVMISWWYNMLKLIKFYALYMLSVFIALIP
jgi:hypothetical protein